MAEPRSADLEAIDGSLGVADVNEETVFTRLATTLASTQPVHLVVGGETVALPESMLRILRDAADVLGSGEMAIIMPLEKELTTREAARLLNISRPYLRQLLEQGKIPYFKVGTHHRVAFADIQRYKDTRDKERSDRFDDLMRLSEEAARYPVSEEVEPRTGLEVYSINNERIGMVGAVDRDYIQIHRDGLLNRDLRLPRSAIAYTCTDGVYLSVITDQAKEIAAKNPLPDERLATQEAGRDYSRDGKNTTVPVVKEQLKARIHETGAGTARIVKDVTEEQQTIDVPVEREEVYVTERVVNRPATEADLSMRARDIEIPLREQEVVTQKQAVVTGEVNVRKETVRDTERVTDTVRREDVRDATDAAGTTVTDKRQYDDAQGDLMDGRVDEGPKRWR